MAPATPMRLLLVGNPESVHVRRWAEAFTERGHEVVVAGLWEPRAADADARWPVHRLGRASTSVLPLRRLVRAMRPDVVHAHYLTHYGWIAWASGARPYAVTLWGSDVLLDPARSAWRRLWARIVLRGAAMVTADSAEIAARAVGLGARRAAVHEIQFGVDTGRFRPGSADPALAARLGVVGRRIVFSPRALTVLYRVGVVIEAMSALGPDVVLVQSLAGADPAYVERIRGEAASRGLDDRIRLVPTIPHDEIDAMYRLADVVVSIPASDGTPVSILEAMSTGIPVVATDLPSVRPWLAEVRRDLLVPVDDVAATARALHTALSMNAAERERLAGIARGIVVDRADHDREMDKVDAAYRRLARR